MDPKSRNTQKETDDILELIDSLPQPVYQLCQSGQSVNELAHLVKNMIQMVGGAAEIIGLGLEREDYDRLRRSWSIFEPNLARLKKFLLDLIKYTKHYPLQKTDCDMNQLVRNAIASCHCLLKNKNIRVEFHDAQFDGRIPLDAERISETVANLITHALDNLPEHAGQITITTQYLRDHQQVQVSVCDDGPALSEVTIRALARPHERTRDMCGTGFDIPLAKLYIEQHDGYMELDSSSTGNGVHVYLPVQE